MTFAILETGWSNSTGIGNALTGASLLAHPQFGRYVIKALASKDRLNFDAD
ncbi:MAG: hypothetical protein ABIN69_10340 [Aestuariivirga sp.]